MTEPNHTKCEKLFIELSKLLDGGEYRPHQRFFSVEKLKQQYNVSQATVTETLKRLELNGRIYRRPKSGTYISPPQKVRQILLVARSNRTENDELNSFLYHSEQDASQAHSFKISFITEEEFLRDFDYLEIIHRNTAGVIFFRLQDAFAAVRDKLQARNIVPVFYGSSMHRPQLGMRNCYYYEEKEVVYTILDRLYQAGHRKIGCAYLNSGVFAYRKQLYVEWMIEHGLFVDSGSLFESREKQYGVIHDQLIKKEAAGIGFTALFATHYGLGIEAILAFASLGVRIPEEVAIIGIGSSTTCRFIFPRLTSLLIDHSGDAARIIRQMGAAVQDPSVRIGGMSRIRFLEGQTG
jgi:DNA-binding LacI/PurR family transcriptional regulator